MQLGQILMWFIIKCINVIHIPKGNAYAKRNIIEAKKTENPLFTRVISISKYILVEYRSETNLPNREKMYQYL